jgi:hypothetical protein
MCPPTAPALWDKLCTVSERASFRRDKQGMGEEEARLELLKIEIQGVQSSIQSFDSIIFQIKGWCVSAALAVGGFAASSHTPGLTLIGMVAIIGFFFINCQFKVFQRAFIRRGKLIDAELKSTGIMRVLRGKGNFDIVGTAILSSSQPVTPYSKRVRFALSEVWHEARLANTFTLYLFLFASLAAEAVVLFV